MKIMLFILLLLSGCLYIEVEFDQDELHAEINRIVEKHIRELGEDFEFPDTLEVCTSDGLCQIVIIQAP